MLDRAAGLIREQGEEPTDPQEAEEGQRLAARRRPMPSRITPPMTRMIAIDVMKRAALSPL